MTEEAEKRGLSLNELLQLAPMKGSEVVAGDTNTDKLISRINIIGGPDILDWVRADEFIMTNGYPFRDTPEEFALLIEKLQEKNVAGIGIKVKRFIPSIPESLIKKANELHFPVVEIPPNAIFSDVVRVAMEEIFNKESEHLITLYNRVQEFSIQVMQGNDISDVIYQLEKLMGNSIMVYDLDGNIIAPLLEEVLDSGEVFKVAQDIESKTGIGIATIKMRDESFRCYSTPLTVEGLLSYIPFIACIETNYKLTEVDCLTIEKVSSLLNMELANKAARKKIEHKYLNQFIQDLLIGDVLTNRDLEIRTSSFELDLHNKWFQVIIIASEEKKGFQTKEEFHYFMKNLSSTISGQLLSTTLHGEFVLVAVEKSKALLQQTIKTIQTELEKFHVFKKQQPNYVLCVGDPVHLMENIMTSYQRAINVKTISEKFAFPERIITFKDLHLFRLLYLLPQTKEVDDYLDELVGPLERHKKKGEEYIETLEVYFQSNRNIRATADKLFTHYNTIVYRIEKISALLNIELENPESSLELQVALKLRKMRQDKGITVRPVQVNKRKMIK
ncbi:PucR family transcriptional regulator [Halalkalibacter kiskunsagensis]|uniref:PucR family transcriptional regulator n=1 Tax=Halalkalibacter kiskunsagensis TaxID=1548599 RepID=A0ABV6K799_9BACI